MVHVKQPHVLVSARHFARVSKSVVTFSEKAIFEKFVKLTSPKKFQLFWVFFNLMHHAFCMRAINKLVENWV